MSRFRQFTLSALWAKGLRQRGDRRMVTRSWGRRREVGTADDTRGRPLLAEETWSRVGEIIETALSIPDAAARERPR